MILESIEEEINSPKKKESNKNLLYTLFSAIKSGRGLAIVDTHSRQIIDVFSTKDVAIIIRKVKGID